MIHQEPYLNSNCFPLPNIGLYGLNPYRKKINRSLFIINLLFSLLPLTYSCTFVCEKDHSAIYVTSLTFKAPLNLNINSNFSRAFFPFLQPTTSSRSPARRSTPSWPTGPTSSSTRHSRRRSPQGKEASKKGAYIFEIG